MTNHDSPRDESCADESCADESWVEPGDTDADLHRSLAQLLRSPADLETRTQHRVASNLMSRSLLGTSSDLLTVGWETVRFLIGNPADTTADRPEEVPSS